MSTACSFRLCATAEFAARLIEAIALPVAFQGQLSPVLGWLNSLPEARVRIAQTRNDRASLFLQDALHLLDRLLQDAEAKARLNSVLEILVLRALALEAHGNARD